MCELVAAEMIKQKVVIIPEESKCELTIKDGPICGYIDKIEGGTYYRFKSIPYAAPPIGKLRFLPPSPVKPWTEVKDCTQDAPLPMCHPKPGFFETHGSEDCLYIEVCSPCIKPKEPMPVMFWIGGLKFAFCMDHIFDASLLTDQNIVFVRCGYRLGPFGFLSVNEYTAPGNCGLKDLVMALKWVQENISVFGGDPNNVTIFGNSTGGVIVHFMMLSPMATGLFHKAIIQSASALNSWSLEKNPSQAVIQLGKKLGIEKSSKVDIIEELRNVDAVDIITAFYQLFKELHENPNSDVVDAIFKPCIELDLEGQPAFITKSPPLVMKSGNFNKVPLIVGSNNVEGALLQFVIKDFYEDFEKFNENPSLVVPKSLAVEGKVTKEIGQQLLKFYLGGDEYLSKDTRQEYLHLISDYYFSYYVNKTVRIHSAIAPECPIYYYVLNIAGDWSVPEVIDFFNSLGHCAELPFLFRIKVPHICKGSRESVSTRKKMIKMWTNFAKTGNPTPVEDPLLQITWDRVESEHKLNYLSIGSELTKGVNPFHERMQFWDNLHKEHMFLRALVYFNDLGVSW